MTDRGLAICAVIRRDASSSRVCEIRQVAVAILGIAGLRPAFDGFIDPDFVDQNVLPVLAVSLSKARLVSFSFSSSSSGMVSTTLAFNSSTRW